MSTTQSHASAIVTEILRVEADNLYQSLLALLDSDGDPEVDELTRQQEQEIMLFAISLMRVISTGIMQMAPYLGPLSEFGVENFEEITMYADDQSIETIKNRINECVFAYTSSLLSLKKHGGLNIEAALDIFAARSEASDEQRQRFTSVGTVKYLDGQLNSFKNKLINMDSRVSELHHSAIEWLKARASAPNGQERHYGSFGIPEIGLSISPRMQQWNPDMLDPPLSRIVRRLENDLTF
ncbi:hypothetical protein AEP_00856 [Curvibacter sp. AEP1-3]|uniref:hypothetical protein n=1 Tax=Curvibacter sp. AEP1-3 TaxID=1844971 RepID=UPI000B3BEA96|nr:hypothetical protein [Curvibacter sp. AEP1-3]ARV17813.1 hypothetical protein AEP_00856 [Curvibacter sp. AEP1-3]